jgi:ABC-2 type transport system ATP-binding protein
MPYAIQTVGLTRVFGDFTAVDQLGLKVEEGTFFGFLGPNGAGKSTTIKMLTGLLKITSGSASVLDHDIASQPVEVKKRIGVVPEDLPLFDRLTAVENLTFVGQMYGVQKDLIQTRSGELLELMDLQDEKDKLVVDYSHGMKKKLALAAALIHDPKLLFLDEPFEGIDAISSRLIKDLLTSLTRKGVTIFLTSHILEIVEKLCTDIAIINEGRLAAQSSMAELQALIPAANPVADSQSMPLEEVFLSLVTDDEGPAKTLSWLE